MRAFARFRPLPASLLLTAVLCGCATLPDSTVKYYLAKTVVSVTVVRVVTCDAQDHPVIVTAVTPAAVHTADLDSEPQKLDFAGLKGAIADTDVTVNFYDDGRLKGINAVTEGQAEPILKAVLATIPLVAGFTRTPGFPAECKYIADHGDGKSLTLTYFGRLELAQRASQEIHADVSSTAYQDALKAAIGVVCARITPGKAVSKPIANVQDASGVKIIARQPAYMTLKVGHGQSLDPCPDGDPPDFEGPVTVAQYGTGYEILIPPAPAFGKQTFAASFAESGALTSLQYARTSGFGQVVNVVNAAATAFKPPTTAEKAAEIQAQADLIAQMQRLAGCKAKRADCK